MPFGVKNAPQIFQRMMDKIFGKTLLFLYILMIFLFFPKLFMNI